MKPLLSIVKENSVNLLHQEKSSRRGLFFIRVDLTSEVREAAEVNQTDLGNKIG